MNKLRCHNCHETIESDYRFCINCGSQVRSNRSKYRQRTGKETKDIECPNCNKPVDSDYSFCINCGANLLLNRNEEENSNICLFCNAIVSNTDKYCINCGKSVVERKEYSHQSTNPKNKQERSQRRTNARVLISEEERRHAILLGLTGKVTIHDIRKRYKELISQYHPDRVHNLGEDLKELAEKKTKELNEAYEFFRKKYSSKR